MPQMASSSTSFSRLWQLSKSSMPGPEMLLMPEAAASTAPMPVSRPACASSSLASESEM
jgi:hypothetical protein